MRNNYIVNINILSAAALALLALAACQRKPAQTHATGHAQTPDSSITALTQPVNARVIATIPVIKAESGTRIFTSEVSGVITYDTRRQTSIASRAGGRIERLLIKYNYQPVQKGQLIMEIYSPELAAAQRELLLVAKQDGPLKNAAQQRLQLLGMQPAQIAQVLKTGRILYRVPVYSNANGYILEQSSAAAPAAMAPAATAAAPSGDGMGGMGNGGGSAAPATPAAPANTPVMLREGQYVSAGQSLFTIYQADNLVAEFAIPASLAAKIKLQQRLLFYPVQDKAALQPGTIGLIEPVYRNGQNFTLVRVYLGTHHFRAGQLLTASIPLVYREGWWLPAKAVYQSGNQSLVFRKTGGAFTPETVTTGAVIAGMVQVTAAIGDWEVASNAAYLVDSESFIKTR
ncbi:efflux RND transporter periplasmic adaptor subunit [Chitinophaga qingshengii]|uniref:Efflux RND transporter periplasmic adaptor subunit n=1 Tax=Chitinophaga qingshengii TaxID=1569794 RepID=A0ABR7THU9_9BACT|nr:efflux RND transporter periplasmic adaptor subunit [Chitinophaga qingshengii]MBC9929083.1 efflux RND transporter periplasmic adaptor subunit [Chitinophaga qingshengii]